uniref:Uncharacterized protein n=1 Tax=Timema cristinae TaxID=61476 RepID=A0A7R9D963_TIMCR|nr:unnamed protein product [Timema cristinae]
MFNLHLKHRVKESGDRRPTSIISSLVNDSGPVKYCLTEYRSESETVSRLYRGIHYKLSEKNLFVTISPQSPSGSVDAFGEGEGFTDGGSDLFDFR